jgi:hypothetical protein
VGREHAYKFHSPLEALDYDLFDVHLGPGASGPSSRMREAMRIGPSSNMLSVSERRNVERGSELPAIFTHTRLTLRRVYAHLSFVA